MSAHRVDVVLFAVSLCVSGLIALALLWSGTWAYAALASATGHTSTTFTRAASGRDGRAEIPETLEQLLDWHGRWAAYVIGITSEPPSSGPGGPLFTADEYAHMSDVRVVFRGAESIAPLALTVIAFRLFRARRRGAALLLIRDGSLMAAALVALIGVIAVIAFDPLFLLFHEVFFPQGNFLFDPATSNLLRLYPEWYWQGVTAGVGVSFVALALGAAATGQSLLSRPVTSYTRAA